MITNTQRTTPHEYVSHYNSTMTRIIELVSCLSDGDESVIVQACPEWSVKGLVSHVAGLCEALSRGEAPPSDTQVWVDLLVAERANQSLGTTLEQWQACAPQFAEVAEANVRIAAPITYDLIVHEHDLRHALNLPGERDNDAVLVAMSFGALMIENDLKNLNKGSLFLRCGQHEWQCGPGDVALSLDLTNYCENPIWETLRLTGSRRSKSQLQRYPWQIASGHVANGQSAQDEILSGMLHMDPPLIEINE